MDGEKGFCQDVTRRAFISRTALMTLVTLGGLGSAAREICWGQSGSSNKAKLREKYRGLSRQELLDKTYAQGVAYESNSGSCSQCTAAALHEFLEIDDAIVRAANSSCGGQAVTVMGTCGGVIGGTMVLDYFLGRPVEAMSSEPSKKAERERFRNAIGTAKLLCDRFVQEYGSILCSEIQRKLFGRTYYLPDPDEFQKFLKAGAHSDPTKCMRVVGNASKWTMEILLDKGVVEI
jgi:C_GCAxxG_C_C family probable redox protein